MKSKNEAQGSLSAVLKDSAAIEKVNARTGGGFSRQSSAKKNNL